MTDPHSLGDAPIEPKHRHLMNNMAAWLDDIPGMRSFLNLKEPTWTRR
jgi:hypothetical protein